MASRAVVCQLVALLAGLLGYFAFELTGFQSAALAYAITLFDGASVAVSLKESRAWPALQRLDLWTGLMDWLVGKQALLCSASDEAAIRGCKQAVVAAHPHGILSLNHAMFFTNSAGYHSRFPNLSGDGRRDLGASVIFLLPLFRDLLLWWGCVDAGKATARKVLSSGRSVFVYPGGEKEQMITMLDRHRAWVTTRKGFCRLAVQFGIPVIPHYSFGETAQFSVSRMMLGARMFICDKLHVALPLAFGRWGVPFPFGLPRLHSKGMHLCVGPPVYSPCGVAPVDPKDEHFDESVDALHTSYLAALHKLFDENKAECGYPDAELELLPELKKK